MDFADGSMNYAPGNSREYYIVMVNEFKSEIYESLSNRSKSF